LKSHRNKELQILFQRHVLVFFPLVLSPTDPGCVCALLQLKVRTADVPKLWKVDVISWKVQPHLFYSTKSHQLSNDCTIALHHHGN